MSICTKLQSICTKRALFNKFISRSNLHPRFSSGNTGTPESHIVRSDYADIEIQRGNYAAHIMKDFQKWNKHIALTCTQSSKNVTYGEFRDQVSRWGSYLHNHLKLRKGSVVATFAPNTVEGGALIFGTIGHGYVYTGINPTYTFGEAGYQLSDCNADVLVVFGPLLKTAQQALSVMQKDVKIVTLGPTAGDENFPRVEDILNDASVGLMDFCEVTGDETMALMYTSGTTGKPKGVEHSHNSGIHNLEMMRHSAFFASQNNSPDDQKSFLMLLPHFHVSGFLANLSLGAMAGIRLFNVAQFNPATFMNTILDNKITHLHLVPSLLNFVLSRPECKPENFQHLEGLMSGAAPVPATAMKEVFEKIKKNMVVQHAYGMTEVLLTHQDPIGKLKIGYTGKCAPGVQCKVIDIYSGKTVRPTETGEICIKTPTMMKGYLNRPEATKDTIDSEGWIHTGDVGCFDDEGYLKIIDRTKELIKVNALQVSPSEIEDVILQLPEVVEVSVIGVPHNKTGEAPRAYVVAAKTLDQQKVIDIVKRQTAKHKHLTGGVVIVDSLPKNATGKVMRKELVKLYLDGN